MPDMEDPCHELLLRHARRAQHECIAPAPRFLGEDRLLLDVLRGVGDEYPVPVLPRGAAQAAQGSLEHRVLQVGHDEGDGVRAPEGQAAGQAAGLVTQGLGHLHHLRRERGVDGVQAVHHAGDGRLRHARLASDVLDRHPAVAAGHRTPLTSQKAVART